MPGKKKKGTTPIMVRLLKIRTIADITSEPAVMRTLLDSFVSLSQVTYRVEHCVAWGTGENVYVVCEKGVSPSAAAAAAAPPSFVPVCGGYHKLPLVSCLKHSAAAAVETAATATLDGGDDAEVEPQQARDWVMLVTEDEGQSSAGAAGAGAVVEVAEEDEEEGWSARFADVAASGLEGFCAAAARAAAAVQARAGARRVERWVSDFEVAARHYASVRGRPEHVVRVVVPSMLHLRQHAPTAACGRFVAEVMRDLLTNLQAVRRAKAAAAAAEAATTAAAAATDFPSFKPSFAAASEGGGGGVRTPQRTTAAAAAAAAAILSPGTDVLLARLGGLRRQMAVAVAGRAVRFAEGRGGGGGGGVGGEAGATTPLFERQAYRKTPGRRKAEEAAAAAAAKCAPRRQTDVMVPGIRLFPDDEEVEEEEEDVAGESHGGGGRRSSGSVREGEARMRDWIRSVIASGEAAGTSPFASNSPPSAGGGSGAGGGLMLEGRGGGGCGGGGGGGGDEDSRRLPTVDIRSPSPFKVSARVDAEDRRAEEEAAAAGEGEGEGEGAAGASRSGDLEAALEALKHVTVELTGGGEGGGGGDGDDDEEDEDEEGFSQELRSLVARARARPERRQLRRALFELSQEMSQELARETATAAAAGVAEEEGAAGVVGVEAEAEAEAEGEVGEEVVTTPKKRLSTAGVGEGAGDASSPPASKRTRRE